MMQKNDKQQVPVEPQTHGCRRRVINGLVQLTTKITTCLAPLGFAPLLEQIGKADPFWGATGYSVVLSDSLWRAGETDRACRLMQHNLSTLLASPRPHRRLQQKVPAPSASLSPATKRQVLDKVMHALNPSGARVFLTFGTLLGLVRERGFMEHDTDLDLGIFTTEASSQTVRDLLTDGGFTILEYEGPEWPCRLKAADACGYPADIMFFKPDQGYLLTYIRILDHLLARKRTHFNLVETDFCGRKVWIPEFPERFLEENYGNWKEPSLYHNPILCSRLTDFSLPLIAYLCVRTFYRLLAKGAIEDAGSLLDMITEQRPNDPFWVTVRNLYLRRYST